MERLLHFRKMPKTEGGRVGVRPLGQVGDGGLAVLAESALGAWRQVGDGGQHCPPPRPSRREAWGGGAREA